MKINLTLPQKVFLVFVCFAFALVGFMIKLPSGFRHMDKELHAAFYFSAAALLNILFAEAKLIRHGLIFFALYLFGIAIEYAQAYSNKFFHSRIHGRFDPEDVQWNVKGLLLFSALWLLFTLARLISKRTTAKDSGYKPDPSKAA